MKDTFARIMDVLVETINFIVLSYLLCSAALSFNQSMLYILFFASAVWLTSKYWDRLKSLIMNQGIRVCVLMGSFLILVLIMYFGGYLSSTLASFRH
ncbi:MAG: hypothetical protein IJZ34_10630 [Lachnospiraceae bacterium]|nr:hypothetical protein [Lachnospiraceae bacterium]